MSASFDRNNRRLEIRLDSPVAAAKLLRVKYGVEARIEEGSILLPSLEIASSDITAALVQSGNRVSAVMPENAWLDRLFLDLTTAKI